jgi:hypothetical protein
LEKIRSMHSRLDPLERTVVQHFHVWTLYPKIYLARTRRALPPDQPARNLEPRYNVAPTTTTDAAPRARCGTRTRTDALGSRAPEHDSLSLQTHVLPIDIVHVTPGMKAEVRFTSLLNEPAAREL